MQKFGDAAQTKRHDHEESDPAAVAPLSRSSRALPRAGAIVRGVTRFLDRQIRATALISVQQHNQVMGQFATLRRAQATDDTHSHLIRNPLHRLRPCRSRIRRRSEAASCKTSTRPPKQNATTTRNPTTNHC